MPFLLRYLAFLIVAILAVNCSSAAEKPLSMTKPVDRKELIVLAAPIAGDPYYADKIDQIIHFQLAFAKQIAKMDRVLILSDQANYQTYVDQIGQDKVAIAPQADIWMRDFGLSNPSSSLMFDYTAAGQGGGISGQSDADAVQQQLYELLTAAELKFDQSNLLNDGGNFVDDYAGNVVISTKFLHDNRLSERQARKRLQRLAGMKNIAFIEADEQGGLEHADGVVAFIGPNLLVINSYPQDKQYADKLKADLRAGLPDVKIFEIITPYDGSQIYDDRFGSACGLYTNMLVTPDRIYLPQFGIDEDKIALQQIRQITSKTVIPVASDQICQMGGGVRCMSWQLRGQNAQALLQYFGKTEQ